MKGLEEFISILPAIIVSSIGGIANYIYKSSKGETFNWGKLVANIFLAGRLGYIIQGFVPNDSTMFGPILAITGFSAYPILQYLEKFGVDFIIKFLKPGQ